MSRRDQVRMTDEEVAGFLEAERTVHVATIGPDDAPHLTTMWYGLIDGRIAFWTYAKSQKVKNLERDPRITLLVESGDSYATLRGVQIRGRAQVSADRADVVRVGEAVYVRNADRFGDVEVSGGAVDANTREALEVMGAKRVSVIVEPERVVSWDHGKLGGRY